MPFCPSNHCQYIKLSILFHKPSPTLHLFLSLSFSLYLFLPLSRAFILTVFFLLISLSIPCSSECLSLSIFLSLSLIFPPLAFLHVPIYLQTFSIHCVYLSISILSSFSMQTDTHVSISPTLPILLCTVDLAETSQSDKSPPLSLKMEGAHSIHSCLDFK